jgi:hypothetical protein
MRLVAGLALVAMSGLLAPGGLDAQTFRGTVSDVSTKRPLENATVALLDAQGRDLGRLARTDAAGRYHLHAGVAGSYTIRVTRLGYEPLSSQVTRLLGGQAVTIDFAMAAVSVKLGSVVVTGRTRLNRDELMSTVGFDLRRSRGVGLFLDTVNLSEFKRQSIAFVLEDHGSVPKISIKEEGAGPPSLVMLKGVSQRGIETCKPQIFIDGWNADLNRFGAQRLFGIGADEIYGVEIYSPHLLPPPSLGAEIGDYEGKSRAQTCGAIAVWTKAFHASRVNQSRMGSGPPPNRLPRDTTSQRGVHTDTFVRHRLRTPSRMEISEPLS